nr:hypothetical protein [uncultured Agathobaculum sp.]
MQSRQHPFFARRALPKTDLPAFLKEKTSRKAARCELFRAAGALINQDKKPVAFYPSKLATSAWVLIQGKKKVSRVGTFFFSGFIRASAR